MDTSLSRTHMNNSRRRALNDKISYGIIATPPSPTNSSPTLTQSTSNSNSTPSTSPQPSTPPRTSRSRTRYPDLGRVPLHRRGTSKTYERLEDLLREAGYKETRVFTPEGERANGTTVKQDANSPESHAGARNGVGAFVEFLAGLMPNAPASRSTTSLANPEDGGTYSPPASPLAQKQVQKQQDKEHSSRPMSASPMTSSIESLEVTPRPLRSYPRPTTPLPNPSIYTHSQSSQQDLQRPTHLMAHYPSDQSSYSRRSPLPGQSSQSSLYHRSNSPLPIAGPSYENIAQPRPSRAGAYLRHMASTSSIPKRPSSTPAHQQSRRRTLHNDAEFGRRRNENMAGAQPPLPPTWIESVARAVLFGGMGAFIGGPSNADPDPVPPAPATRSRILRPTRSSISQASPQQRGKYLNRGYRPLRSGLSDQTNTKESDIYPLSMAPPEIFTRIERGRSQKSAGEVTRTQVVCRSAPASRASSAVRGGGETTKEERQRARNGKELERAKGRGRAVDRDRLPSLANTQTEGDLWASRRRDKRGHNMNRFLSGWGMEGEASEDGGISSSEEEDGELDLARMLVNPKRQNSIKSLRKHLTATQDEGVSSKLIYGPGMRTGRGLITGSAQGSRSGSVRVTITDGQDLDGSEVEGWGQGWARKGERRRNSQDEDDDESFIGFLGERTTKSGGKAFGSGRSTGGGRLGIPSFLLGGAS